MYKLIFVTQNSGLIIDETKETEIKELVQYDVKKVKKNFNLNHKVKDILIYLEEKPKEKKDE